MNLRLAKILFCISSINAASSYAQIQDAVTTFTYDNIGNIKTVSAPLGRTISYSYDAFNRVTRQERQLASGAMVTTQGYDGLDQVASVTDPRNFVTAYTVDGLGNTSQLNSPDTQIANYTFDEDSRVQTYTDARGKTTRFQYDALGRLLQQQYQSGVPSKFEYDGGPGGSTVEIGNLTRLTDESGSTVYTHDTKGRVLTKTQIVSAVGTNAQLVVYYSYGTSGSSIGKLESITYPSGTKVSYRYDDGGQVTSVVLSLSSISGGSGLSEIPLLTDIVYTPMGEVSSWRWNSPVLPTYQRTYDLDGRLTSYPTDLLGTIRTVSYDAANRITSYAHTGGPNPSQYDQTFGYDTADRLTSASLAGVTTTYGYDANGNRTQQNGPNVVYAYDTGSNRLKSASFSTPRIYSYDAAGNRTGDGRYTYTYSDRGRLSQVRGNAVLDMYYNALGQRVLKVGASKRTYYVYDEEGHTIAEYDQIGTGGTETVYLGNLPIAVVAGQQYFHVLADHLNTPLVLAQQSGTIVWDWRNRDAFGNNIPLSSATMPSYDHRFPGQVADIETGNFYNYFRDYDPLTGRYIESDPIGLNGGINTYAYVDSNPLILIDVDGLQLAAGIATGELATLGGFTQSNGGNGVFLNQTMDGDGSRSRDPKASRRRESNTCPPSANSASGGGNLGGDGDDPDDDGRPKTGKSDRHGDKNAMSKAQKQIDKLQQDLERATSRRERQQIEQKIKNISQTAQRNAKGETHWMK